MTREILWEYELRFIDPGVNSLDAIADMNAMGQAGWEIVGFFDAGSSTTAITYKRPIEIVKLVSITKVEEENKPA